MDIPDSDKLWCVWKELTKEQTDAALERIVTRAVTNHAIGCGIPDVEAWAARWLSGADREAATAEAAAQSATRISVWSATQTTAETTARAVAWSATQAAAAWATAEAARSAEAAARAAADTADTATEAWAAELKLQIADVRAVLRQEPGWFFNLQGGQK